MFSPAIMAEVAKEQRRDLLKEAEIARLLQPSSDPAQARPEASPLAPLDHLRNWIGGYLRKDPARI